MYSVVYSTVQRRGRAGMAVPVQNWWQSIKSSTKCFRKKGVSLQWKLKKNNYKSPRYFVPLVLLKKLHFFKLSFLMLIPIVRDIHVNAGCNTPRTANYDILQIWAKSKAKTIVKPVRAPWVRPKATQWMIKTKLFLWHCLCFNLCHTHTLVRGMLAISLLQLVANLIEGEPFNRLAL